MAVIQEAWIGGVSTRRVDDLCRPWGLAGISKSTVSKPEVKRRADVVGIFPSEASIIRFLGAVLLEANDEWQMQHRYMGVEAMGEMLNPPHTNETLQIPPKAA